MQYLFLFFEKARIPSLKRLVIDLVSKVYYGEDNIKLRAKVHFEKMCNLLICMLHQGKINMELH